MNDATVVDTANATPAEDNATPTNSLLSTQDNASTQDASQSSANGETVTPPDGASEANKGQSQDGADPEQPKQQSAETMDWRHRMAQGLPEEDRETFINESARSESEAAFAK